MNYPGLVLYSMYVGKFQNGLLDFSKNREKKLMINYMMLSELMFGVRMRGKIYHFIKLCIIGLAKVFCIIN